MEIFANYRVKLNLKQKNKQFTDDNNNEIKVGRISYINVDPVYYQFDHEPIPDGIRVISRPTGFLS